MEVMNPVKRGDKVLVRADISDDIDIFHIGITSEMLMLAGKIVTVTSVDTRKRTTVDEDGVDVPYLVQSFNVKGMSEMWVTNLIVPLDAEKAFDALLRGHIDDKTYKKITEETL